jgi:SOS-response transcriptional repressor LexA
MSEIQAVGYKRYQQTLIQELSEMRARKGDRTEAECMEVAMTPDQKEVFLIVDEWWKKYGYSPTLRDIAYVRGKVGLGNTQRIVTRLVELGVLKRLKKRGRTIRPVYIRFQNLE